MNFLFRFHEHLALLILAALYGFVDDTRCFGFCASDLTLRDFLAIEHADQKEDKCYNQQSCDEQDVTHTIPLPEYTSCSSNWVRVSRKSNASSGYPNAQSKQTNPLFIVPFHFAKVKQLCRENCFPTGKLVQSIQGVDNLQPE